MCNNCKVAAQQLIELKTKKKFQQSSYPKMNSTNIITHLNNTNWTLRYAVILPEYFSLFLLALILRSMYKCVEIGHPLFAVLFLNLVVTALSSALNVSVFAAVSFIKFIMFFNYVNTLALLFHCTSWCVTSAIRYLYISHEEWLFDTFPSQKTQCHIARTVSIIFAVLHILPPMIVIILFGKHLSRPLPYLRVFNFLLVMYKIPAVLI